jgi:phospholipase/carboxylesterase
VELLSGEIESRPPVLLLHGDADQVVPPRSLPAAVAALEANGVSVTSELRPGLGHGIDERGLQLGADFLVRHLP